MAGWEGGEKGRERNRGGGETRGVKIKKKRGDLKGRGKREGRGKVAEGRKNVGNKDKKQCKTKRGEWKDVRKRRRRRPAGGGADGGGVSLSFISICTFHLRQMCFAY